MLEKFEQSHGRLSGRHDAIDTWLAARRELLVRYCQLSGLPTEPGTPVDRALPTPEQVHGFCALLVDYVSTGHFEIYERLLDELEHDLGANAMVAVKRLYPAISRTTDAVLAFDEAYGERADDELWPRFDDDLSALGEHLANRFELEDELMALFAGASRTEQA